jgi:hypothetical protein
MSGDELGEEFHGSFTKSLQNGNEGNFLAFPYPPENKLRAVR